MKLGISFGALSPSLLEQITACGKKISAKDAARLQRFADSICRLNIRDLLTDSETHKARARLMKLIVRAIK